MYDAEKCSTDQENAAGFARQDAYIYSPVTKWQHWVCLYNGDTNLAFPRALYELELHKF